MKSIWTGSIGFGLVNIPIKIYSATQESNLDFDMLDKKDNANIKFMRVNEKTGKEVSWDNIVKGYMLDDRYVILSDDDFAKASPEKTKTIHIEQFCMEEEVDTVYYENVYFLEPEKSGTRAYALLRDALAKTGKVALGTYVLRSKETIGLIKPQGNVMMLYKLRFADEIRTADDLKIPEIKSKPAEIKMAESLIDQLTEKFDISAFKDNYNEELLKLIQAKAKGKPVKQPAMKVVHSRGTDLMDQLKMSLGGSKVPRKKAS